MGYTGCRTIDEALAVARRIAKSKPYLRLIGVEGFEGAIHGATPAETDANRLAWLEPTSRTVEVEQICS